MSGLRSGLHRDPGRSHELLRREPAAYRFPLDAADVDLWAFDALAARAVAVPVEERLCLRDAALELVRGEVLADEPYVDRAMPSVTGDEGEMEWISRFMRLSVSLATRDAPTRRAVTRSRELPPRGRAALRYLAEYDDRLAETE